MILYFTGTGNSAFIAKRIAEKTGDTAVDVFPMIREHDYGKLSSRRPFVVVCPTYGWQIPHVLGSWLRRTRLSRSRKLYFVMTCGDGIGMQEDTQDGSVRKRAWNIWAAEKW